MAVLVSFVSIKGIGSNNAPGIGGVRITESLALDGTTTATVNEDEVVMIGNAEAAMVRIAFGRTPNAAAAASTEATSAGFPVGAGQTSMILMAKEGDKINAKALA